MITRIHPAQLVLTCGILAILAGCSLNRPGLEAARTPFFEQQELFVSGTDGYHTYRIPALIVTARGTLLAFCEGRKNSGADSGDIDILFKRSTDAGRTWEETRLIADHGPHTIGNPCPVVDRKTGTIWLLLTGNLAQDVEGKILSGASIGTRTVWVCRSDDDGITWTTPVEITSSVKDPAWTWYATGPGCGIQLRSGRMVIPCDHNLADQARTRRSHVIYSDDHGQTWKLGGVAGPDTNECQVVELADGTLMLNMRNYAKGTGRQSLRAISTSTDAGQTWTPPTYSAELVEPVCQAAFVRFADPLSPPAGPAPLLFSNPASTKRANMTVRVSYDEGRTWPIARQINPGPSAYSALAVLPDRTIALFYERGEKNPYEKITLARFSFEWLTSAPPLAAQAGN
ncbi:MAG TPA: sialidase family protein [Phycisphaerae bacterium]|nr:sialidase family protein [Phycisphaerae bacterium]HOJ54156.1 sialidase family protein [Phycisphaerae bacterium]HOL25551.1 sialidase family protein [Phycisphaerae bacterium]HPP21016.1 sialidase family protein [Phycisphaerae bacterium]HPU31915.1 sialidase family protein [Phycisphaerae bacterium]